MGLSSDQKPPRERWIILKEHDPDQVTYEDHPNAIKFVEASALTQAELERDNLSVKYERACKDAAELEAKLNVAVEALEFYADARNYTLDDYHGISGEMLRRVILYGDVEEINDVTGHAGRRARAALARIKRGINERRN